jgi:hypothetical protein
MQIRRGSLVSNLLVNKIFKIKFKFKLEARTFISKLFKFKMLRIGGLGNVETRLWILILPQSALCFPVS